LLPSRIESVPVVFSDAAQAGTPVVATPVGDLPRIFGEFDVGILADSNRADDIAQAIREALDTDAGRFAAGLDAAARQFDVAAAAKQFADRLRGGRDA